jgi:hypothetical protein
LVTLVEAYELQAFPDGSGAVEAIKFRMEQAGDPHLNRSPSRGRLVREGP